MRAVVWFLCLAGLLCGVVGCERNSIDIAAQVKKEMQEQFTKKAGLKNLVVEDVVLVKERDDGIDYTGVATGNVDGEQVKFDVKCKYDGHSVLWDAELADGFMATLAVKESAKELCKSLQEAWPGIKKSVKESCDDVAEATGEAYDSAKQKAGEYYDKAKVAVTNLGEQAKQKIRDLNESSDGQ